MLSSLCDAGGDTCVGQRGGSGRRLEQGRRHSPNPGGLLLKLLTLAAACAALTTFAAAPAFASDPVVAKLAQPVAQPTKFIAGGAMFICADDACTAQAATSETFALATCKAVAGKVGPVASFTGVKAMDDARLSACNSSAVAKAGGAAQLANK